MTEHIGIREEVRAHYAERAIAVTASGCCGSDGCDEEGFGAQQYTSEELAAVPITAGAASLGCGNPTAVAELRDGEVVLDLGSGAGIDVLLSARRVGPEGKAYGLDMTDEMLELARRNAAEAAVDNVEFLKGYIEEIPLPDGSVDVVISNCVINLSVDKSKVFAEMSRVLRTGGRIGVTDVVVDDTLTDEQIVERGSYVGCVAGALRFSEYRAGLVAAGLQGVDVIPTHSVGNGVHSAIVRADKP